MVQRQTYRRHVSYNTKSNKVRLVKTPGGKLVYQHIKKKASPPLCGDTKKKLIGMRRVRPSKLTSLKKRERRVSRAYGGSLSASAVRTRIVRAFLIEEQKAVNEVMKLQALKEEPKTVKKSKKN